MTTTLEHNVNPNTDRCVMCGRNRFNRERQPVCDWVEKRIEENSEEAEYPASTNTPTLWPEPEPSLEELAIEAATYLESIEASDRVAYRQAGYIAFALRSRVATSIAGVPAPDLSHFLIIEPHADGSVYVVNPDPLLRDPINGMDAVVAKCGSVEEARQEARRLVTVAASHRAGVPAQRAAQALKDAGLLSIYPAMPQSSADMHRVVAIIEYSRGIGEQAEQEQG